MREPRLRRASTVALAAGALWVGAWGMDRLLARGRVDAAADPSSRLAAACESELQRRLPPGPAVRISGEYRTRLLGTDEMRLVSSFAGRGTSATPFACDLKASAGSWEVSEITVVSW